LADTVASAFAQTLTSDSAWLAMAFAKPPMLPEAAKVFDFSGEEGAGRRGGRERRLAARPADSDFPQ
jgi:hypothetical protein